LGAERRWEKELAEEKEPIFEDLEWALWWEGLMELR
jgi:hypothetical protein